jgi:hypothetical protein
VTRIPIDVTAPVACTANRAEIPIRIDQVTHLRERLRSLDRTPAGLLLHFEPDADLQADLDQFARDEKGCCQFWGFEVATTPDLTLRWDGPPDAQELLDELHRFFASDEPLTAFSALF